MIIAILGCFAVDFYMCFYGELSYKHVSLRRMYSSLTWWEPWKQTTMDILNENTNKNILPLICGPFQIGVVLVLHKSYFFVLPQLRLQVSWISPTGVPERRNYGMENDNHIAHQIKVLKTF